LKNRSALSLIFLTVFIDLLGFGILIPILPSFSVKVLHIDDTQIGIAIALYSFMQFLFNPVLGRISDKHGRKPVIVACLFLNVIGYLIFSFTNSFIVLLISRIVGGLGGSSVAVALAYIADVTDKENRSRGMGIIGAAFGLGFVFGPLMGGLLSSYGYAVIGYVAAGFSFVAFIVTIIALPESLKKDKTHQIIPDQSKKRKIFDIEALKNVVKNHKLLVLIFLFFVITFSFANIYATFALLGLKAYGFTDRQNGYMFGILGLTSAIIQGGLLGRINKAMSKKVILIIASFLMSITLALIPYAGTFLGLAIVSIFLSYGTATFSPTVLSLISENASETEQGITLGVNQSLSSLARVLGPLWGGFAFQYLGYEFPFITGGVFTFFIFLLTVFYLPKKVKLEH
jgi:DHA1 family tetracycline resistance protein-like MFS transporter